MIFKRGRYSGFLRPISYLIDLLIIGFFANNIILEKSDLLNFTLFIFFSWIISTLFSSFYDDPIPMDRLIDQFNLSEFLHRDARQLSGGQRQRLLLALALVHNPEIIFLDEPTTGLDPRSRRDLWKIVAGLKDQGRTLILTTHYMEEAEILCDELLILSHGRTLLSGTPKNLISDAVVDNLDTLFLSLTAKDC